MRRASLILGLVIASGCAIDVSSNPRHTCIADPDCPSTLVCYRGFCVASDASTTTDGGADAGRDAAIIVDAGGDASDASADARAVDMGAQDGASDASFDAGPDSGCDAGSATCMTGLPGACATGRAACGGMCIPPTPMTETCGGGDEDCDGITDEESNVACYPPVMGCTQQADGTYHCSGACRAGTRTCSAGSLGACTGAVTPSGGEQCTVAPAIAVDEDCDGTIDEGCGCSSGTQPCFTGNPTQAGVGVCHAGSQTCTAGAWGTCTGSVMPSTETCSNNGTDDDCNGRLDDIPGLGASCTPPMPGMGVCATGTMQCNGSALMCVAPMPMAEVCNHLDDDCDGSFDESFMLASDPANCGSCGHACGTGTTCCNGACVDESSDAMHCGACLTSCGAMAASCCSSMCIDTTNDRMNCGACGHVCSGSQQCCSGQCVDEQSDAANCGMCGHACGGSTSACCQGSCMVPTAGACTGCGSTDCSMLTPSQTCCSHSCVDRMTDTNNCGACGHVCATGDVCCGGTCYPNDSAHCGSACLSCGGMLCCNDACVPVDTRNCQGCGVTCASGNACCGDGCRDLTSSSSDCGTCGMACLSGTHCTNSHCCSAGLTYCGSACTNLNTDANNCGSCGHRCALGCNGSGACNLI